MSKAELKETAGCSKKFHVEIERERLDSEMISTLKRIKSQLQIPGFRKGKAPDALVSKRFAPYIREEAIKDLIPKVLDEVFKENGIKPLGEPAISDFTFDDATPMTFDVTVEEAPHLDINGFEGLKVTRELYEVTEEDVDSSLERLRHMKAQRTIVDRPAGEGDILMVDLQKLDSSGVPIIGEKLENHMIALDGESTPSSEFDRQVIGMKNGDTRTVRFTYDESINKPELVGKTEAYSVTVRQVIENKVPELNDEFARSLEKYTDLKELCDKTRSDLEQRAEMISERMLEYALINEFIKEYPFEVPNSLVEKVLDAEVEKARRREESEPFDEAAFRYNTRPDAVRGVQTYLILDAVKERMNIQVSREEIAEELNRMAESYGMSAAELRRNMIRNGDFERFKKDIEEKKAYTWVKEAAIITSETVKSKPGESKLIRP